MKEIRGKIDENDLAYVVRIRREMPIVALPCPIGKKSKINPHVSRFLMKSGELVSVFHVKPIYYQHLNGTWRPLSEVTYGFGNKWAVLREDWDKKMNPAFLRWWMRRMELIGGNISFPFPTGLREIREGKEIHFAVTTVFPDPNPETTTVDGIVFRSGVNETFATIRGGAGTGSSDAAADDNQAVGLTSTATTDQYAQIVRFITLFDTSSIPDTDDISAATYSLFCSNVSSDQFALTIRVVTSTPASNTALVAADYSQLGTVAQSDTQKTLAQWDDGQPVYVDHALNATGRGNISKTGVTKFGTRSGQDADNSAPTWVSGVAGEAYTDTADFAGTSQDPKLAVTHSAAVTGGVGNLSLLGVS